jgi:hypothetical protein
MGLQRFDRLADDMCTAGYAKPRSPVLLGPSMSERRSERSSLPAAAEDRRGEIRVPASTLGDVRSRLIGGSPFELLNYTSRSLYGQSATRLVIGAPISVRLATAALNAVLRGRVVRSSLTQMVDGVPRYEIAVAFDEEIDWGEGRPAEASEPVPVPVTRSQNSQD